MYRFSYVSKVGGSAIELNRQLFDQIIDDANLAAACSQIAEKSLLIDSATDDATRKALQDEMGALKRQLSAFCWHATFKNGKRNSFSAIPSGLGMIDVDHCDNPRELFESVRSLAMEYGLVAAHVTPSTKGLRMVFKIPDGMTIEGMQTWLTEKLALEGVDGCTKDLARLSFAVPRSYWLYVDYEALFEGEVVTPTLVNDNALKGQNTLAQGNSRANESRVKLCLNSAECSRESRELSALGNMCDNVGTPCRGNTTYDSEYKGIPYNKIVESLETLYGGKPTHGSRNSQIFSMACQLRYICNDDPNWIATILPNYGEAESRWMSTIKSACSRNQVQNMPAMLTKAIEMAGTTMGTGSGVFQGPRNLSPWSPSQDLDTSAPPAMPAKLPKLIRHLIKNVPEVCKPSVANGVFPALATHLSDVNFRLIDGTKKEATFMCINMARQSSGKASVNKPIEYIMADIKEQDEINRRKEQEWKDAVGCKGSNKEKPKRPEGLCVQMLVTDMTNAAFVQRLKDAGGKYIYTNLEELDLLKQLQTNGTKDVGKIICLCFDNGTYGQERVGLQSITALLPLRWNWNASSTIEKGRVFFSNRLIDGTLSRINFCTIISDDSKEFRYGNYDEDYATELKPYITNLNLCKGEVTCSQALAMAKRLQQKCTEIALQTEDVIYQEFSYRAVTIAYMKAMVLYIANDMTWDKSIEDFCEWSLEYDLWCKNYFFGEAIQAARDASMTKVRMNKSNMLKLLPDVFSFADAKETRRNEGKDTEKTGHMLAVWTHRGYIVFNKETEMYEKTENYKQKN